MSKNTGPVFRYIAGFRRLHVGRSVGLQAEAGVQSSPQPMFDIGLSSVATALGLDLGGCLRGYFSLAFVAHRDRGRTTSATGRPRWGNFQS
jgi:hypothetical protein